MQKRISHKLSKRGFIGLVLNPITIIIMLILVASAIYAYNNWPGRNSGNLNSELYCQYGDVYQDGQMLTNCLSATEECQIVNGLAQCVVYDNNEPGDTGNTPGDGSNGLVPTFESIGISWKPVHMGSAQTATVQFRKSGSSSWDEAQDLWFDNRGSAYPQEYRGSIVGLQKNTEYEVKLTLEPNGETITKTISTWNDNFPVGSTTTIPSGSSTYTIGESGSSSGYKVYDCKGNTLNLNRNSDIGIKVNVGVHHIIIKNCIIKNPVKHGIFLDEETHDVVIEHNDISGWGTGTQNRMAGIKAGGIWDGKTAGYRYVIQYNDIHNPMGASNSWDNGHPSGPQGIDFAESAGQNVIRYNSIYTDDQHKFNDAIGGERNDGRPNGFPGPNSDIYGNYLKGSWDDSIEAEGSGENVRIWNNYIDTYYSGIATVVVDVGPIYIFRNVFDKNVRSISDPSKKGLVFKVGEWDDIGARMFILHNTVLQARGGARFFVDTTNTRVRNAVIYNNIAEVQEGGGGAHLDAGSSGCTENVLDYNLYTGNIWGECSNHENHGFRSKPVYDQGTLYSYPDGRRFKQVLAVGTSGHDDALLLANFNDGYEGSGPDMGAIERGSNGFCFGSGCTGNNPLSFILSIFGGR